MKNPDEWSFKLKQGVFQRLQFNLNLINPRFDTLKFSVPKSIITGTARRYFKPVAELDWEGEPQSIKKDWKKDNNIVGIREIQVNSEYAIFEISAKILGDKYLDLIHIGTIHEVFKQLQRFVKFNADELLESAVVFRCDVTKNLRVSQEVGLYIDALNCLYSPTFRRFPHKRETVEFKKNGKYSNGHLSLYDKETELKLARNKYFLDSLSESSLLLERFRNVLRVERKFKKHEHVRKAFDLPSGLPRLKDILHSTKNPILDLFQHIKSHPQPEFVNSKETISKIISRKGYEKIVEEYNYDADSIYNWVKIKSPTNSTYYKRKFRVVLEQPRLNRNGITNNELLDEIERLIRDGQ